MVVQLSNCLVTVVLSDLAGAVGMPSLTSRVQLEALDPLSVSHGYNGTFKIFRPRCPNPSLTALQDCRSPPELSNLQSACATDARTRTRGLLPNPATADTC